MQERRTTIRVAHRCRAQYCTAQDLLPRDGWITNVSERGAGLLTREAHRSGEQLTVTFSLPGADDLVTATGEVRWSDQPPKRRWYPVGLEWFPLEETAGNRLKTFLAASAKSSSARTHLTVRRFPRWTGIILIAQLGAAMLIGSLVSRWVQSLRQENQQLQAELQQRNLLISTLEQDEAQLQEELEATKARFVATTEEVARLDQQAKWLEMEVQRLGQDVERFQGSYVQVREEREALMQRVLDLEQERTALTRRLSSVSELRRAIREAVDARNQTAQAQRRRIIEAKREASRQGSLTGNRGYLLRKGRSTAGTATMWIRVHEPEPLLATP